MNSNFFVTDFASRKAASTASAPPEKSWRWVIPSGSGRGDALEELGARLRREAAEGRPLELLLEARDIARMRMAEAADRDAGDEVEILVAVDVGDRAALRMVDDDLREERDRLQAGRHRLRLVLEDRLRLRAGHGAARKLARGRGFGG